MVFESAANYSRQNIENIPFSVEMTKVALPKNNFAVNFAVFLQHINNMFLCFIKNLCVYPS